LLNPTNYGGNRQKATKAVSPSGDTMIHVLETFRDPKATDFGNAWVGMEPTFQTKKSVCKWRKLSE
jgi:hypothetical protein